MTGRAADPEPGVRVPVTATRLPARPPDLSAHPGRDHLRATRTTVAALGAVVALAAAEHGLGEVLHRPEPDPYLFQSWPGVDAFAQLSGEPAMTVLPDVTVAGALTVVLGAVFLLVAVRVDRVAHAGRVLFALSLLLLLSGGGIAPPLIGMLLALTWGVAGRPRRAGAPGKTGHRLARRWRGLLVAAVSAFLALFPGTVLLHWWFGIDSAALVAALMLAAFLSLFLVLPAALARDRLDAAPDPEPPGQT